MHKTWYVSCSPRSPEKLAPELAQFATIEGKKWNAKDGNINVTQIEFTKLLADKKKVPTFEGSISKRDPAFSARDRVKPYKTFGFAYVDDEDSIVITPAGRRLIEGKRPKELFLKQLLKWQYPSYQHRGKQYQNFDSQLTEFTSNRRKKPRGFYTLPFVDTLSVIRKVGGLSKREIAMFMLPKTRMDAGGEVTRRVLMFRKALGKVKGRVPRKRFVNRLHHDIYSRLYADETKGKKNSEANTLVMTRIRSSLDVADATIRHFRYTGILTVRESRLTWVENREADIDAILGMGLKPIDFFGDVHKFYDYVGNPDTPRLPFESESEIANRINAISSYIDNLKRQHPRISEMTIPSVPFSQLNILLLNQLKDLLDSLETVRIEVQRIAQEDQLKLLDRKKIVEAYDRIVAGDDEEFFDRPVYFEWNTYRALVAIDNAIVKPNFVMDEALQPVSLAPGKKADLVAEFGDFVVVTEVTLTAGKRQYMVEGEPVVDHVGSYRVEELRKSARRVFGLFIAPKVVQNTANYFHNAARIPYKEYGGSVTVIPIQLNYLKDLITLSGQVGGFSSQDIRALFEKLELSCSAYNDPTEWVESIEKTIVAWKADLLARRDSNS
jgi:hypothetical protein